MAITRQLVLLRMEDIAPFAEARSLVTLAKQLVAGAAGDDDRRLLADLHVSAVAVAATVAEALRAGDPREEIRRLREATMALGELRLSAWDALAGNAVANARFDEVMAASARCRREVEEAEAAARRRGRLSLDGAA